MKLYKLIIPVLILLSAVSTRAQTQRIITAGSAITETVCALGEGDKIVASDRTSLYPPEIQKLPSIGYRSGINAEGILSLKPTLIIAEKDYVDDAVLKQLSSSGVQLLVIDHALSLQGTKELITRIASALGKVREGESLIRKIETEVAEARALGEQASSQPKVLCIYNRGTATISVAGEGTFAEILEYVGATTAIANTTGYKPLNTESLVAANPDYLLMVSSGFESLGGLDGVLKIPGIAQTTAGKKKQIVTIESLKLTNFGPRLGEATKELVLLLHPELRGQ